MIKLDFFELGGTLFIPASHKDLESVILKNRYPNLKSIVIDTEDGLNFSELESVLQTIKNLLIQVEKSPLHIFLRPRSRDVLEKFLGMRGIENIRGFVLPKFSLDNAEEYLKLVAQTQHMIMPSIEGKELFNVNELVHLRDILLEHKERIVIVRFGLEDMLSSLSMRRNCNDSVFDFSVTSVAIGNLIGLFKSVGFAVSGGVYPCFKDSDGFVKDVKRDLKEGLFSKTLIHPKQIDLSHELYKVSQSELDEALKITASHDAVFSLNDKMAEHSTMYKHSLSIIKRSQIYGVTY